MHNIIYNNGLIESELFQIVNIHKPFHSKVDKVKRKASLTKLIISPDETRQSSQIKRFLVSVGNRYAYKMHVTYKNNLKCHNIYDTNSAVDKLLRTSVIKEIIDNVDTYPNLKHDLINIIRVLTKAWEFDCLVTDIPWLSGNYSIPVIDAAWHLISYDQNKPFANSINLLFKEYERIPLNLLPFQCLEYVSIDETDIEHIPYACPLILTKSNSYYAGFISNTYDKGLPVSVFKISGKVY